MKTAVVLGAYGYIGAACVRALQAQGFVVSGVGRSKQIALQTFPDLNWVIRDIATTSVNDWRQLLRDADIVVNASGALQDGAKDNLVAIHQTALERIVDALKGTQKTFVQISAAGVSAEAPTPFFRTKAQGDDILRASDLNWVVLRPALVLGPEAYGGSALLRAAAALPLVRVSVFPDAQLQTIHIDDLAEAVCLAVKGQLGYGFTADLAEDESRSFPELTDRFRQWQGFAKPAFKLQVPKALIKLSGKGADLLSWLGWRSPLRTNALLALESGITANSAEWKRKEGLPFKSLDETLRLMPSTPQERSFARLYLLLPLAIGCLSVFWVLSGLIGFWSFEEATGVLTTEGVSKATASTFVALGGFADILLGFTILWRRWTKISCIAMIAVSFGYLAGATLLTPQLWGDPLGPLVKVFPAIVLAAMVPLLLEKR